MITNLILFENITTGHIFYFFGFIFIIIVLLAIWNIRASEEFYENLEELDEKLNQPVSSLDQNGLKDDYKKMVREHTIDLIANAVYWFWQWIGILHSNLSYFFILLFISGLTTSLLPLFFRDAQTKYKIGNIGCFMECLILTLILFNHFILKIN